MGAVTSLPMRAGTGRCRRHVANRAGTATLTAGMRCGTPEGPVTESGTAETTYNLGIVIASTRPTRVGGAIGTWVAQLAQATPGWHVQVADLREIDLPMMNEPKHPRLGDYEHDLTKEWSVWVDAQDAFIFVFPEYNHTFTAPIKNALDHVSQEWAYKPVGLVSYGGVSGGLRAAQALKLPIAALRMLPITDGVTIQGVGERVVDGIFSPIDSHTNSANVMLAQLHRAATAMQPLRNREI